MSHAMARRAAHIMDEGSPLSKAEILKGMKRFNTDTLAKIFEAIVAIRKPGKAKTRRAAYHKKKRAMGKVKRAVIRKVKKTRKKRTIQKQKRR